MSLEKFLSKAVSSWMSEEGPDSDIVLSTRIRLARNINEFMFPTLFTPEEGKKVVDCVEKGIKSDSENRYG